MMFSDSEKSPETHSDQSTVISYKTLEETIDAGDHPQSLEGYFNRVEKMLKKTFREDSKIYFSMKTQRVASMMRRIAVKDRPEDNSTTGTTTVVYDDIPSYIVLSPRLDIGEDGSTYGKFKTGCKLDVVGYFESYNRLIIDSLGCFTAKFSLDDIGGHGVKLNLLGLVNTLQSSQSDHFEANVEVNREGWRTAAGVSRTGAGALNAKMDLDVRVRNVHLGMGIDKVWNNYIESETPSEISFLDLQRNDSRDDMFDIQPRNLLASDYADTEKVSVLDGDELSMYIGAGIFGPGWCMAGMLQRQSDTWGEARISLYQNIRGFASMAIDYALDVPNNHSHLSIGMCRRFFVPSWWNTKRVVAAFKFSTHGMATWLTELKLDKYTKIGLVGKYNLLKGGMPKFGVLVSVSTE